MNPRKLSLPNGQEVWTDNPADTLAVYEEIFERHTYAPEQIVLTHDSIVFDVGANIGLAALYFAGIHGVRQIHSFEPVKPMYALLQSNFERHSVPGAAHCAAIGGSDGSMAIAYYPEASVMSGLFPDTDADASISRKHLESEGLDPEDIEWMLERKFRVEPMACTVWRLETAIRRTGVRTIDLLKVDAEKSEFEIFACASESTWALIRQVIAEVHNIDDRVTVMSNLFESHGFTVSWSQDPEVAGSEMFTLLAQRQPTEGQ